MSPVPCAYNCHACRRDDLFVDVSTVNAKSNMQQKKTAASRFQCLGGNFCEAYLYNKASDKVPKSQGPFSLVQFTN